ncbi:MAG: right-handed parallel beta-helix repeat-containing protein [Bacteroidales bacterium]|nr:right-handed parallel beta-helix repeat-containing protein [Bacteroidales bacterium]
MKRQLFILLIFAWFLSGRDTACGQVIYVGPSGNDMNPGTRLRPLATLEGARDRARELKLVNIKNNPIEIIILEGEYFLSEPLILTREDSGTPTAPVVYKSEPGKKPVFYGGIKLAGFERVNEKLWRMYLPEVARFGWDFEQLFVNGKRAVRARTPSEGFLFIRDVAETVVEKGTGRAPELAVQKIFLDSAGAGIFSGMSRQEMERAIITFYHKWDNTRKPVYDYNPADAAVFTIGTGMKPWNPLDKQTRYFVENYRGALDAPGEWFLEPSGNLYYVPREGENLWNSTFIVPVTDEFLVFKGDEETGKPVENIKFEGIAFKVAGYRMPEKGNEAAQAAAPVDAVVNLDFARNITFIDCEIAHTGKYAFWFRRACSNCNVVQCYMHDLGAGGVKIGETVIRSKKSEITNNIIVDNNIIRDAGHLFPCAVGIIIFNASDNKLTHNEISSLRYSGISVGWVWGYAESPSKRNIVEFNHIHHLGWGELCDMGGVYTLGASEGTRVTNNLIHHIYSFDYGGWGLYTDEGSYGIVMENNLVYACKSSGFHQHYGKENIIRNNIFAFNIRAQLQATRVEEHRSFSFTNNIIYFDKGTLLSSNWNKFNLTTDLNCYWDTRSADIWFGNMRINEWQKSGKDKNSIIADPLFRDPGGYDFRFRNQSVIRKIRFEPFDYSMAGVYGPEEWKKLAETDPATLVRFDRLVEKAEAARAGER